MLHIHNLFARFETTDILNGVSLDVNPGEVHAIMGPNGSGKSTLSKVIAGHPSYEVTSGAVELDGEDVLSLSPEERTHKGLFLVFQQPREIAGVHYRQFLHTLHREKELFAAGKTLQEARKDKTLRKKISPVYFRKTLEKKLPEVKMGKDFLERSVNEGFSGGEKKKSEILQMELLQPSFVLLDELDSGLDVDALRVVCERVNALREKTNMGIVLITHYPRILEYIAPDKVHLFAEGTIQKTGGMELAREIEEKGYLHERD